MSKQILTITEVNNYIRSVMDNDHLLASLCVKGEISNYKVYPSGHHYFTLKDGESTLKCVMFRGNAMSLKFRPENGMQVLALGRITVYPRDGAYQLYCTGLLLDGVGDLYAAFEQTKAKLAAQGLFDQNHKKEIPKYPNTIGIITSEAGAAVHDIIRILNKRYPLVKVRLIPTRVQGAEAPGEIALAIRLANQYKLAAVLIVGRGGGSIEDLWAFNDETVARAIYDSDIPVISAVGHEPDITISDFVADLRAATPTNGAELAVPDQNSLRLNLDSYLSAITAALKKQLNSSRNHLKILSNSNVLKDPGQYIRLRRNSMENLTRRLQSVQTNIINDKRRKFVGFTAKLDAMSPLKVLTRGYAIVQGKNHSVIRSIEQVKMNTDILVTVSDGIFTARVTDMKEKNDE